MPETIDTSFLDTMPANVAVQFFDRVAASPDSEAFRYPRGEAWESVTWKQAGDRVDRPRRRPDRARHPARAAGRHRVGHALRVDPRRPRDDVRRRRHHHGLPLDQCRGHRLHPRRLRVPLRLRRGRRAAREAHRAARRAAARRSRSSPSTAQADGDWVISLDDLADARRGPTSPSSRTSSHDRVAAIEPDQLATLIYTSGTTGRPKGVRLRHTSLGLRGRGHRARRASSPRTTCSSCWLPMAHSFGKVLLSTQLAVRLRHRDRRPRRQDRRQPRAS